MPPHDWFSWIWAGYVANRDDIVPIATFLGAVAAFITAFATLIYVMYSIRMLKQLREQTDQLRRSTSYDADQRVIDMLEEERLKRHEVYVLPHEHSTWSKEHREAAEKIMRVFDLYGFLDRNGSFHIVY